MISPGSRPSGTPAITTSPRPAMTTPRMTRLRPTRLRRVESWPPLAGEQLEAAEEVAQLEGRRVRGVGAVRRVALDALAELLAERAGLGLGGVGRTHQRAPLGDGVRRLERQDDARARRHEVGQGAEERPRLVDGVEALGLALRHVHQAHGADSEPFLLDAGEDGAGLLAGHG